MYETDYLIRILMNFLKVNNQYIQKGIYLKGSLYSEFEENYLSHFKVPIYATPYFVTSIPIITKT